MVRVTSWAGRTCEQKKQVARKITEVRERVGIPAQATHIVFDTERTRIAASRQARVVRRRAGEALRPHVSATGCGTRVVLLPY